MSASTDAEESANAKLATGLELEFLGTSSAASTTTRNVSALALHTLPGTFLFDCGEGTARQLIRSTVKLNSLDAVFITHLHGDHCYGLPGLAMRTLNVRAEPIRVYGPLGIYKFFMTTWTGRNHLRLSEIVPPMATRRHAWESVESIPWDAKLGAYQVYENSQVRILAVPIKHTVFCLGYVIEEKAQRGSFLVDKLYEDFGIVPGPIYKQLEGQERFKLPDGRVIPVRDYQAPAKKPRKLVILGDTSDPSAIAPLAMGADVLVHEATNTNQEQTIALTHGHSTAGMAGAFAKRINAKTLILTHFSPRNFKTSEFEECAYMRLLLKQAKEAFGKDSVYAASDFWRYAVPQSGEQTREAPGATQLDLTLAHMNAKHPLNKNKA